MARCLSLARLTRFGVAPFCALLGLVGCSSTKEREPTTDGVNEIVYAVRQHTLVEGGEVTQIDVAGGMGQVMDYGRFVPGGRLEIFDLRTHEIENIIEEFPTADVSSVDLNFDATQVVFTMKRDEADKYHVYVSPLKRGEDGKFAVSQLTFGPFDDQSAVFGAGERIVFTTNQGYTEMGTRADEYNHSRVVTQLATTTVEGGDADRKLCSQNLSHIVTLFSMHDGRIGFARWEHLENVNDVKLFAMNPDCTQVMALGGQHGKPGNSIVQATESATPNVFYSIVTANSIVQATESATPNVFYSIVTERENTIQAGALVKIDARSDSIPGAFDEEKEEDLAYTVLTPDVPLDDAATSQGRYRSPAELPNGDLLVSWADGPVNELSEAFKTPPDYGLYKFNLEAGRRDLILNHENSWELYAKPVVVRPEPPNPSSRQVTPDSSLPATIGSLDVARTSLTSKHNERVSGAQFDNTTLDAALAQAVKVRVIEGFSSEAANQTMFGLTMAEGAALLGEATVQSDGSWLAQIPPYVPVHLQPVDEFDLAIRNQTTWIQAMPGEGRVCGGCHEDRTAVNVSGDQALTLAAAKGPENFMIPVRDRIEYPWAYADEGSNPRELQKLLNAKCVSCHNETTNGGKAQETYTVTMTNRVTGVETPYLIPRLDLSDRPITVTYDRNTKAWPASYVSLFYPAALEMEMGRGTEVTGTVPPKWAVPSDARHSVVLEKLNITSSKKAGVYAWALGQPFSVEGVQGGTRTDHAAMAGLTRDETVMLIRAIDMGGQFYARQNTQFVAISNDPVARIPGAKP